MSESNFIGSSRALGAIVATIFGAIWLFAWWQQVHSASHVILVAIAMGAGLIIGIALLQSRQLRRMNLTIPSGYRASRLRLYGMINIAYWPLLAITVVALGMSGHPQWINAAVICLVGLHFFPLAHVFRDRLYYLTGMLLVLLAVLYPVVSGPGSPLGLLGAGAILWLGAVSALAANNSFKPKPSRLGLIER